MKFKNKSHVKIFRSIVIIDIHKNVIYKKSLFIDFNASETQNLLNDLQQQIICWNQENSLSQCFVASQLSERFLCAFLF